MSQIARYKQPRGRVAAVVVRQAYNYNYLPVPNIDDSHCRTLSHYRWNNYSDYFWETPNSVLMKSVLYLMHGLHVHTILDTTIHDMKILTFTRETDGYSQLSLPQGTKREINQ